MAKRLIKITKIARNKRQGKNGKEYTSVGIQIDGFDGWINGFGNAENSNWDVGTEVEIDIKKVEKDGKTYYNFVTKPDKITRAEFNELVKRVEMLENKKKNDVAPANITSAEDAPPTDDDDFPF